MSKEVVINRIKKTVRICPGCHGIEDIKELEEKYKKYGYTLVLESCGKNKEKILEF